MGWFGRSPRKVGFGVSEAQKEPPRPRRYQYNVKQAPQNKAWDTSPTPATKTDKPSGTDILDRRDTAPMTEAITKTDVDQMTRQQIDAVKRRSPWLGNIAERIANAQAQRRVGTAKQPLPTPKKTSNSRFLLIMMIFVLFFLLGPFLSGFLVLLG